MKKSSPSNRKPARKRKLPALNESAVLASAGVDPIRHVVVLMLENRSFDHLLGSMKSLYPELRGIDPNNPGVNREGSVSYQQKPNAVFQLPYGVDPEHKLADVLTQLDFNGPCGGFIHDFIQSLPDK